MGRRDEARAQTEARILAAARAQIAEHGGVGLSMRAVARDAGMVSSAVYRYFETREALITAMILESYAHLAEALGAVRARRVDRQWRALAEAFRRWALEHPHEFQL
ncbi:MAG: helix-turn-helix domain-containing protein, partial [Actinomycetia bacterium]|nr:helix-turn-helix domain-containing protein [Actinomycetes bacterium]